MNKLRSIVDWFRDTFCIDYIIVRRKVVVWQVYSKTSEKRQVFIYGIYGALTRTKRNGVGQSFTTRIERADRMKKITATIKLRWLKWSSKGKLVFELLPLSKAQLMYKQVELTVN